VKCIGDCQQGILKLAELLGWQVRLAPERQPSLFYNFFFQDDLAALIAEGERLFIQEKKKNTEWQQGLAK
jgi:hypothetical protein